MNYEDRYTWQHVYDDHVIINTDGSCSVLIEWAGIDVDMLSNEDAEGRFLTLRRIIDQLPSSITTEWHLWRERSGNLASKYMDKSDAFIRAEEVGRRFRQSMADHLSRYAIHNEVGLVLTWHKGASSIFPKRGLKKQADNAEKLLLEARRMVKLLPGAKLCDASSFFQRLQHSYNHDAYRNGRRLQIDEGFFINEQVVSEKPFLEDGMLKVGNTWSKVILLFMYPDAFAGLSVLMCSLGVSMHFSHIVRRADKKRVLKASERAENFSAGTISNTGTESKALKIDEEGGFRRTVIANDYHVFSNTFIVHLHSENRETLKDAVELFAQIVEDQLGGQLRLSNDVQLLFWRYGQPGQGYRSTWSRLDHSQQVGDMLPVQVYDMGHCDSMMLRLGRGDQLIGYNYDPDLVNHSFTVAMTGGGKGVNKVAQIIETYPLGIDWYIMEVGTSYQWTVEALGGTYTRIDPADTVVNPLPLYSMAEEGADGLPRLPLDLLTGTVEPLSFILADSDKLTTIQNAVVQGAFTIMYAAPEEGPEQPSFETLLNVMHMSDDFVNNEPEAREARAMRERLESFLSTAEGKIFSRPNNFALSEGITGVDLLLVRNKARNLLKFYLVFLSLAFTQRAFSSKNRSRILLDEMHVYASIAPDVIKPLISGIARMGRKDGASLDLVTQETDEIDLIERAVINMCPWQSFLYRQADWDMIGERTNMPGPVLERWRAYEYPLGLPYRPAIQKMGESYHDLYLTFPENLLLLASSDKSDLDAKAIISKQTQDPFERLVLLKEHKENLKNANAA